MCLMNSPYLLMSSHRTFAHDYQAACVARGLGMPPFLQPRFADRSQQWAAEADGEAEEELRKMLDGQVEIAGEQPAAASAGS